MYKLFKKTKFIPFVTTNILSFPDFPFPISVCVSVCFCTCITANVNTIFMGIGPRSKKRKAKKNKNLSYGENVQAEGKTESHKNVTYEPIKIG